MSIRKRVYGIVSEALGLEENKVTDSLSYDSVSKWDSLGHITLVMDLEKEFDISFNYVEVSELNSVGAIISLLESKITLSENKSSG